MARYSIDDETWQRLLGEDHPLNDAAYNKAIATRIVEMGDRARQQPNTYLMLFREALELAEDQFKRAMRAEEKLAKILMPDE